jgi:putative FmdB family regulatory protein
MPIYEYECQQCSHVTEALQKFSDRPLRKCPQCGGKLQKLMSLNAFSLKGDGWYVTDYKGKNPSNGKGGSEEKPAKKDSKPGSKKPKAEKSAKKD